MAIFGFGKKKETTSCGCGGACEPTPPAQQEEMALCDCGGMCPVSEIEAKKQEIQQSKGCCGEIDENSAKEAQAKQSTGASVKVLGSGCKKCNQLEQATKEALESLSMDTEIDHVTDFADIASYGVMTTPALVVDGKVVSYGKVLKTDEVVKILQKVRG